MSSPFFRSPSGDLFTGDSPGAGAAGDVFPKWNPTLKAWEPATLPSSGGSIDPLSIVTYVDLGTVAPTPDGSIAAPYADLQDAIDARGADTYRIVPGGYGDLAVPAATAVQLSAMAAGGAVGTSVVTLDTLDIDDNGSVCAAGISAGPTTLGTGSELHAFGTFAFQTITGGSVSLYGDKTIRDASLGTTGNVNAAFLAAIGTSFSGNITSAGDCYLQNCSIDSSGKTITVAGDLYIDLLTLTSARAGGAIFAVTGDMIVVDAPTKQVVFNVDASGAPAITQQVVAFAGALAGDTFAAAPVTNAPLSGVAIGSPYCVTDDQVVVPIIMFAGAASVSMSLQITRFTVADVQP